jgi:hypothetical protein
LIRNPPEQRNIRAVQQSAEEVMQLIVSRGREKRMIGKAVKAHVDG